MHMTGVLPNIVLLDVRHVPRCGSSTHPIILENIPSHTCQHTHPSTHIQARTSHASDNVGSARIICPVLLAGQMFWGRIQSIALTLSNPDHVCHASCKDSSSAAAPAPPSSLKRQKQWSTHPMHHLLIRAIHSPPMQRR